MRIAVCGLGRAGKELARKIISEGKMELVMAVCRDTSISAGRDVGELLDMPPQGIEVYKLSETTEMLKAKKVDVVIDFSAKEISLKLAEICEAAGTNLVVCTTNFSEEEKEVLRRKENKIGIVFAPNLTLGINLLIEFVAKLSKILPEFDFEIVERHRRDKPRVTTTARLISKAIDRGETPISSVRIGGYVGVHEVTAASEEERITIEHESFSRQAFAKGALLAAEFVKNKKGFYEMKDVIAALEEHVEKEKGK